VHDQENEKSSFGDLSL